MTKALVTIEVDIDTGRTRDSGIGENGNPDHHGIRFVEDEKRGRIWDCVYGWIEYQDDFISIRKVSLIRESK
jgi:hypothetical protein